MIAYAHRLVWVHNNGPIPKGVEVNHKDGDKTNNRLDNLELVTHAKNIEHSYRVLGGKPRGCAVHDQTDAL